MMYVFTMATGPYKSYIETQLNTIVNFFPNIDKELIIITDGDDTYDSDNVTTRHLRVTNLMYNINCLCKTLYVQDALERLCEGYSDDDVYMYVDADTIYLDRPQEVYDRIYDLLNKNDLVVSRHILFNHPIHKDNMCRYFGEDNKKYAGWFEPTPDKTYCCSNVFGGTIYGLKRMNALIREMFNHDMGVDQQYRHFPAINEETYINKIANDHLLEHVCIRQLYGFKPKDYMTYYNFFGGIDKQINDYDDIIILSKYKNAIKENEKPKVKWIIHNGSENS